MRAAADKAGAYKFEATCSGSQGSDRAGQDAEMLLYDHGIVHFRHGYPPYHGSFFDGLPEERAGAISREPV